MSRPIGVTAIAVLLIGVSLYVVSRALADAGGHGNRGVVVAAFLLAMMALVAAEALWSLRSHAFLTFVVWGLCGMVSVALMLLRSHPGAHAVRALPPLVYAGLAFAAASIYLRRAL